jgi:NAD(P)-dependent dehydrogenase (short-subunit alcohol dehydrogenase family)
MRKILVTGANKGIGLAIAKAILDEHADTFVYLGSRDAARGKAAAESLGRADRVQVVAIDVGNEASVREAAKHVTGPLYGIVNNAGIGRGELADVLRTNVYGIHNVCEAFLPLLDPNGGRIVNVTSASGPSYVSAASPERKKLLLDTTMTWPRLDAFMKECLAADEGDAYGLSKACANLYTILLAREHPKLHINACTPGFIETDLTQHYATSQGKSPEALGMKPPSAGARAPMHLLFATLEGNGRYYGSDAQRSPLDRYRSPGSAPYTGD